MAPKSDVQAHRAEYGGVKEAAAKFNMSEKFFYDQIEKGTGPPHLRFGRRIILKFSEVEEWAREQAESA